MLLDTALAIDPVRLAEHAGLRSDPWQAELLRSSAPRVLINASRQSGKSTVVATAAVHQALFVPGSLVLLLSPTLRQSGELFRKCLGIYGALDHLVPAEAETGLHLELENGSRIVSLPGREGTVRGYSGVALLAIDEAAWVAGDLYASVRPMLATSGGRLIALSTPHGRRGFFFEAWRSPEPWQRYEVPATECARIPAEFLEEERRSMGQWWFEQEYMCRFLDANAQAFRREDIDLAFAEEVTTWVL